MATSPTNVTPVLDFEAEEAGILQASPGLVEVVVEESGTLAGLSEAAAREPGFDVIHLSGHGKVTANGPRFVVESDTGLGVLASADDIAGALNRHWPRLVFVSGCWTGDATDSGAVESLAEALVMAGAPAVLGWGLPVGDLAANSLAADLYRALGSGESLVDAVAVARRALFTQPRNDDWHLLRLFADRTPLSALVTAQGHPGRARLQTRPTHGLFLDPEGRVRVADRESFVGRRRDLQTLLRELRPADPTTGPVGAVIHGMGGLGKSSLTARLLERMRPTHPMHVVWTGKIDAANAASQFANQLNLDPDTDLTLKQLLNLADVSLADKLRYILSGPLADASHQCVFVFDDFENGNLEPDGHGGHLLDPAALEVLAGFATAITSSGSSSRIVITSRYTFHQPDGVRLAELPIAELQGADLNKLLRGTKHLGPLSDLDRNVLEAAVTAAAGIPRLINSIDDLITAQAATPDLLDRIGQAQVEYRDKLVLNALLDAHTTGVRRLLGLASVYQIAVPLDAIRALHPGADTDITAAVGSGLLQAGTHPSTNELRYLVSPLLRPLLADAPEYPAPDELRATQSLAAQALYKLWVDDGQ
jgi:hypothetical protein